MSRLLEEQIQLLIILSEMDGGNVLVKNRLVFNTVAVRCHLFLPFGRCPLFFVKPGIVTENSFLLIYFTLKGNFLVFIQLNLITAYLYRLLLYITTTVTSRHVMLHGKDPAIIQLHNNTVGDSGKENLWQNQEQGRKNIK